MERYARAGDMLGAMESVQHEGGVLSTWAVRFRRRAVQYQGPA